MEVSRPEPPDDDKRWKLIDATMRRHGYNKSALIETLHSAQEAFGFLEEEALDYIARSLKLPPSSVYGVATFYHFFTLKPQGEHTCVVCTGTACYIKGAGDILDALEEKYKIKPGETTEDGKLSVLTARCLGACSLAPAVVFDGNVTGNLEPPEVLNRIEEWMDNDA